MDKLYQYRKPIRGSAESVIVNGPIAWIDSYIHREELGPIFGGFLLLTDSDDVKSVNRYRGVWGRDKISKLKRILRERGAVFEVCKIDGASRRIRVRATGPKC